MPIRVYLGGPLTVEGDLGSLSEGAFPGRQGRLAFAYLVAERHRPIPRDELAGLLWSERLPASWDTALPALLSKIRAGLASIGVPKPGSVIEGQAGHYRFCLPPDGWIDFEAAADALHKAEVALRHGDTRGACGWALVASRISARSFLPAEDDPWVRQQREWLLGIRVRALECLARIWLDTGDYVLAIRDANEVAALEPYREAAYRYLMRAHLAAGNRAEALRVHDRFRHLLSEELGVPPSPETEAVYLEVLKAGKPV